MQKPTHIWDAAVAGDCDLLRALVQRDAFDVNARCFSGGRTLLGELVVDLLNGDLPDAWEDDAVAVRVLRTLRELGADPYVEDDEGEMCAVYALAHWGDIDDRALDVLTLLVDHAGLDLSDPRARCACVFTAVSRLDTHLLQILEERGCVPPAPCAEYADWLFGCDKPWVSCEQYAEMLTHLLERGLLPVNARDKYGDTPLHRAVGNLDFGGSEFCFRTDKEDAHDLVLVLLQHGADPLATNNQGQTPVDVWRARQARGDCETTTALLDAMAAARDARAAELMRAFERTPIALRLGSDVVSRLIAPHVLAPHPGGPRTERRHQLEALLSAEGIPAVGYYYERCLAGDAAIDMSEFRLRHFAATTGRAEYEAIVDELARETFSEYDDEEEGRIYYRGINADALYTFRRRLEASGMDFTEPIRRRAP